MHWMHRVLIGLAYFTGWMIVGLLVFGSVVVLIHNLLLSTSIREEEIARWIMVVGSILMLIISISVGVIFHLITIYVFNRIREK